jgi:MFS family permease
MQSLIHGNFEGLAMKKTYALVGASAAVGAAIGPLIGGFMTTYLSWRVGFLMEVVIIAIVLLNIRLVRDVAYTGLRKIDVVGAALSIVGMGGIVLGILVWQEGGEFVLLIMAVGAVALGALAYWLLRRKREGKVALLDPDLFKVPNFRVGVSQMVLQQITIGGAMIALPLYLQVTLEYNAMQAGLSMAPLSLTMFAVALLAGKRAGKRRPASIIRLGFGLALVGMVAIIPVIPRGESGLSLLVPLVIAGMGLGLLVSQLNNYILAPIEEERVSEAAGVNSAGNSFGLSFGLAIAGGILLAALSMSFVSMTESSTVIPPADQEQIATVLEDNAEFVSTTQLEELLADQPDEIQQEIIDINTAAGNRALQVAMLVPILACLLGFMNSFRMMRLPDVKPSAAVEGAALG